MCSSECVLVENDSIKTEEESLGVCLDVCTEPRVTDFYVPR